MDARTRSFSSPQRYDQTMKILERLVFCLLIKKNTRLESCLKRRWPQLYSNQNCYYGIPGHNHCFGVYCPQYKVLSKQVTHTLQSAIKNSYVAIRVLGPGQSAAPAHPTCRDLSNRRQILSDIGDNLRPGEGTLSQFINPFKNSDQNPFENSYQNLSQTPSKTATETYHRNHSQTESKKSHRNLVDRLSRKPLAAASTVWAERRARQRLQGGQLRQAKRNVAPCAARSATIHW